MFVAIIFFIILLPAPCPNQELMTISTAIAKIQQKKIESVYLPQQQPISHSRICSAYSDLSLDLSYSWNKINAYGWFSIKLLLMKKNPTHNISTSSLY